MFTTPDGYIITDNPKLLKKYPGSMKFWDYAKMTKEKADYERSKFITPDGALVSDNV